MKRSVLEALRESPLANCTVHNLPWGTGAGDYAAFACPKGCLWSYADARLTVSYLDGLKPPPRIVESDDLRFVEFRGCNEVAFHLRAYGDTFSVLAANISFWRRIRWILTGKIN